jgi:predicted Zn finger-like uncharacterized protein|tara:strand:- start:7568 stop:8044 length:477 start_codon:yes stop_codon:yes gene_type:complete
MIVDCPSCNKKFNIDQNLIPNEGRLLECGSCKHKWFFKNEIIVKKVEPTNNGHLELFEIKEPQESASVNLNNKAIISNKTNPLSEKLVKNIEIDKTKTQKKNNLLNLTIVFIISLVALILLLDTFKSPLRVIVPNIEFLLYNLYETIRDIKLFISDLT